MALDPGALVSLADVAKWIRGTGQTTADEDADLELLVNAKSRAIADFTGRELAPKGTVDVTRRFSYDGYRVEGEGFLDLYPYDLRVVTSITLAGTTLTAYDGTGKLASTEYRLEPRNLTPELTSLWLALGSALVGDAVVVGKWGADAVPALVKEVCLEEIAAFFRNPEAAAARSAGDIDLSFQLDDLGQASSLMPSTRRLLAPFRRRALG